MSYTLAYWRYADTIQNDPRADYVALCVGTTLPHLTPLPVNDIKHRIAAAFDPIARGQYASWDFGDSGFELHTTDQAILFVCKYTLLTDHMDLIHEIMTTFHCRLYDPQANFYHEEP